MPSRLIIHAPNVHSGGGRVLLLSIIESLPTDIEVFLNVDKRLDLPADCNPGIRVKRVSPTLVGRILAEVWLVKSALPGDLVLSFGNLPPLFRLNSRVVVYLQNRYLVDKVELEGFSLKIRVRLILERLWFSARIAAVNEVVVQTPSMKRLLLQGSLKVERVTVFPFVGSGSQYDRTSSSFAMENIKSFEFVYVASGEPHKNHRKLIEAWILLAEEDICPSLLLTLDENKSPDLWKWIGAQANRNRLQITNIGNIENGDVKKIYSQAGALIFPSKLESLGLPLIEARKLGMPVLASELDYVRDVLDPDQTFNPNSEVSIARAVKRHLEIPRHALPLQNSKLFVEYLLGEKYTL